MANAGGDPGSVMGELEEEEAEQRAGLRGDNIGFDQKLFVSPVDDILVCLICQNVVENPAECPCGHLFCSAHIRGWLNTGNNTCPACREPVDGKLKTGYQLHLSYRRQLSELRIHCHNKARGCKHTMPPTELRKHTLTCHYAEARCKWAGCPYNRRHVEGLPPMLQKDLEAHERSCEYRLVNCELHGCNEKLPLKHLQAHIRSCKQVTVTCTIRGCDARMPRGALQDHLEDRSMMPRHLTLLSTEVSRLTAELEKPEPLVNDELVFTVTDIFKKFESPSFRHETKMYTLCSIGNQGYNFRIQLRKREWPEDRKRFNDKLGIYLHMEHSETDDILDWPFPFDYTFTIIDQSPDPTHIDFTVTDGATRGADWLGPGSGKGWGPQGIASFDLLRTRQYTTNEKMFVKVTFHR